MSIRLGAAYLDRDPVEVERAWRERLVRLEEPRLFVEVLPEASGLVRVQIRPRAGRRVPFSRFGALMRRALGPEREERAEFWLLRPGNAGPGPLRLEGASWEECAQAVAEPGIAQLRVFSALVCPGPERRTLLRAGARLGLRFAQASGWVLTRSPAAQSDPPQPPPPWKGNYGW
jgi:hypothetical protein